MMLTTMKRESSARAPRFVTKAALTTVVLVAGLFALGVAGCTTPASNLAASATPVCPDVSFPIYFAAGSDQLSDPARQAIAAGRAQASGCMVREVDVFGLADVDGPAAQNLELSRRRASTVAAALAASGLPRPLFDVQGLGEAGARTASGAPKLLERKVMVVIRLTAKT